MRTSPPPTPSHGAAGHSNTSVLIHGYAVRRINCNKGSSAVYKPPGGSSSQFSSCLRSYSNMNCHQVGQQIVLRAMADRF